MTGMTRRLAEAGREIERLTSAVDILVTEKRANDTEIERLKTTLELVRLYIQDQPIAQALIVHDGEPINANGPTLLNIICEALTTTPPPGSAAG